MSGDHINPYASPKGLPEFERRDNEGQGIWRDGPHLVMERQAQLPAICVKTGRPAQHWVRYRLVANPNNVNLGLIAALSPLAAILSAAASSKTAHIELGLCDEVHTRYRNNLILGWWFGVIGILLVVAGLFVAAYWPAQEHRGIIAFLLGSVLGTIAFIFLLNTKLVDVKNITKEHIWFTGVDTSFLAQLPDYSGIIVSGRLETCSAAPADSRTEIWRDGLMLVLKHNAIFPPVCIATGKPAEAKFPISYSVGGERKTIEFGLSAARYQERSRHIMIAWLFVFITLVAVAAGLGVAAMNQGQNPDLAEGGMMFSIVFAPFLLIVTFAFGGKSRILTVKKVTPEHVWIIGFCPQVRGMFPERSAAK